MNENEQYEEQPQQKSASQTMMDDIAAHRAKTNANANNLVNAADKFANAAQVIPGLNKAALGYKGARKIDKALGGHASRAIGGAASHLPGAKTLGRMGNSGLANATSTALGGASKLGNKDSDGAALRDKIGKNKAENQVRKTTQTGTQVSGTPSEDKKEGSAKTGKGKSGGLFGLFAAGGKNEDGEKVKSTNTFFGEMDGFKQIIVGSVIFIFILIFIIVVLTSSLTSETKRNEFALAMVYSNISSKLSKDSKATTKVGNVTSRDDVNENYRKSDYDLSSYNVEYTEPAEGEEATKYDNSQRGKVLMEVRNSFPNKEYSSYYNIGNIFNKSKTKCYGDECDSVAEVQFYQKVADISYRYKKLYNLELDWTLITATVIVRSPDISKTFASNISSYKTSEVNNLKKTMSLDWDYDYKNIPGYIYLSPNDERYDLQILAKNMVKKTTTQTCVDAAGNVSSKLELIDVEESLIDKDLDNGNYLVCKNGTTYNITNKYEIDTNKYDEFLNEYLEKRYLLPKTSNSGDDNNPGPSIIENGDYGWPLPQGATRCLSSGFGPRKPPKPGASSYHQGHDYGATTGTSVYAIADGVVEKAATGCGVNSCSCNGGAGNYVVINHGNGVFSVYMHSSNVEVSVGQHVTRGQEIMKVGSTGCSTGPHLHIGIKVGSSFASATYVDPTSYIGALPKC